MHIYIRRNEYYNIKNYILHGLFFLLYALVKNSSIPFMNFIRYFIAKPFFLQLLTPNLAEFVTFWFPWKISIGQFSSINQGCVLDGSAGIRIGKNVRIAPYCVFNSVDHEYGKEGKPVNELGYIGSEIVVEDNVWIATHVVINKGVIIGEGSVIGAGSVVTKSIPPFSLAVGVPCKVVKYLK